MALSRGDRCGLALRRCQETAPALHVIGSPSRATPHGPANSCRARESVGGGRSRIRPGSSCGGGACGAVVPAATAEASPSASWLAIDAPQAGWTSPQRGPSRSRVRSTRSCTYQPTRHPRCARVKAALYTVGAIFEFGGIVMLAAPDWNTYTPPYCRAGHVLIHARRQPAGDPARPRHGAQVAKVRSMNRNSPLEPETHLNRSTKYLRTA